VTLVRRPLLGPLGVRLTLAFLAVALTAIVVFAALTVLAARQEASGLTDRQRDGDLAAAAIAAGEAFQRAGDWETADLTGATAIAARGQATLTIVDADGDVVAAPTDALASMMIQMHGLAAVDTPRGDPASSAITVDGDVVGAVMLRFPTEAIDAERHVRDALGRTAILGLVLASGAAMVVALSVSARVTRPVAALTAAAGELAAGRRDTRVDEDGPGELATLARAFNDMADHIDREDQLRRNLVADVAHELRTPLAILQGSTEALIDGVDEPTPEVLGSLNDEVARLRRLVGDLETLAAAEAAGLRLREDRVDLADVANAASDLLRPLTDDRSIRLVVDARQTLVVGDADRLQQIAVNLISNAAKFAPPGGLVRVATGMVDGQASLTVTDDGPGIPNSDLERVFERFWRGPQGATASGSGIGLAVVAELAAAHGGMVSASNVATGGARFTVTLPAASSD
jgi:two-component system sensor histidine kinase BaeS